MGDWDNDEGFYESPAWKALSQRIRKRDGRCLRCQSKKHLCADHIIPRSVSPDLELREENLQTLCWQCNDEKGAAYIVSFLPKNTSELDQWISVQVERTASRYREQYRKHLKSRNGRRYSEEVRANPHGVDMLEAKFNDLMELPEKVKSPFVSVPLFVARFVSMPFTIPAMVGLGIATGMKKSANTEPSDTEVNDAVERVVTRMFSDW